MARDATKAGFAPPADPNSYQIFRTHHGWHILTPNGNEQWFDSAQKLYNYLRWHQQFSGYTKMPVRTVKARIPSMTEVFRVKEAPIGAKPLPRTQFPRMGQTGQNLSKTIDQKAKGGEPYNVWQTQDNQIVATPSQQTGNQPDLKANPVDGTWDPMDPKQKQNMQNQQQKSGPQPAVGNNLMRGGGGTM